MTIVTNESVIRMYYHHLLTILSSYMSDAQQHGLEIDMVQDFKIVF